MNIDAIQNQIIEEFGLFDQWIDRYEYLIELGKKLPLLDARYKNAQHLIPGCQSQVWLHAEVKHGRVEFTADSDALITKGIIALLIRVLDQQTAKDIAAAELFFIDAIGLKQHLSATRSNGLASMLQIMQQTGQKLQNG